MRNILLGLFILVIALAAAFFLLQGRFFQTPQDKEQEKPQPTKQVSSEVRFTDPKKSAHYESNTPAHATILAGVPINVVINFNFDLAKPSEIKILNNSQDYGIGETIIDSNKLTMRRYMDADAPNGLYMVEYNACWPDRSCHDGNFQFAIDRTLVDSYSDQTGKKEVTIEMSNFMFSPQNVRVSQGTEVTWINNDRVEHYVNTDSHPAHTYYPEQNSKALKKADEFSLTFNQIGIYPYHCSAHPSSMIGSLIVE